MINGIFMSERYYALYLGESKSEPENARIRILTPFEDSLSPYEISIPSRFVKSLFEMVNGSDGSWMKDERITRLRGHDTYGPGMLRVKDIEKVRAMEAKLHKLEDPFSVDIEDSVDED